MPSEPPAKPTESKAGGGADPATTDRAAAIAAASRAIEISDSTTRDSATNRDKPDPSTHVFADDRALEDRELTRTHTEEPPGPTHPALAAESAGRTHGLVT